MSQTSQHGTGQRMGHGLFLTTESGDQCANHCDVANAPVLPDSTPSERTNPPLTLRYRAPAQPGSNHHTDTSQTTHPQAPVPDHGEGQSHRQQQRDTSFGVYGGRERGPERARFNFVTAYAATDQQALRFKNSRRIILDKMSKHVFSKLETEGFTKVSNSYANYCLDKMIWDRFCSATAGTFPFEFMRGQEIDGVDDWRIPKDTADSCLAFENYLERRNNADQGSDGSDLTSDFSQLNVEGLHGSTPALSSDGQQESERNADPTPGLELDTDEGGALPRTSGQKRRRSSESADDGRDDVASADVGSVPRKRRRT